MIKKCPKCKSDQLLTEDGNCTVCGTNVADSQNQEPQDDGDQLDIVVTEVPEDDREFVGGNKEAGTKDKPDKSSNTDKKAKNEEDHRQRALSYQPIGSSEPTMPPVPDSDFEKDKNLGSAAETEKRDPALKATELTAGEIKKLSPQEIKAIEKNLYGKNAYLADKEKDFIRHKIKGIGLEDSPEEPTPEPVKSKSRGDKKQLLSETLKPVESESVTRGKGVAYFYKNYVMLAGQHHLTKHDELILNGKAFALQPKKLKPTYLYTGMAVIFALVLFLVGSWFVSDSTDGTGKVGGVVLDSRDKPYLLGAEVRFPDLGITVESNPQGLFTSKDIPAGTHRVEYVVDGSVVGSDHATVLDNGISMIVLRPSTGKSNSGNNYSSKPSSSKSSKKTASSTKPKQQYSPPPEQKSQEKSSIQTHETTSDQKKVVEKSEPGKLVLAANIDNARLKVDGKTLGSGNLTYSAIEPGSHNWEVFADGYNKKSGTIHIESGESKKLAVTLTPVAKVTKQKTYGAEDYFQSGVNALKAGNYDDAISDFTQAINEIPSYPQAYYNRGLAYQIKKDDEAATDDFIRAAEIYRMKKDFSWSLTSFGRAIDIDNSSIPALLGRADLFLAKGEEIAAITDYESVIRLDKRSFKGYTGLGKARFRQGHYKKALEHFKDARSINKNEPTTYQYLMLCYMAVSDFENVKESFDTFKELASDDQKRELMQDRRYTAAIEVANNQ